MGILEIIFIVLAILGLPASILGINAFIRRVRKFLTRRREAKDEALKAIRQTEERGQADQGRLDEALGPAAPVAAREKVPTPYGDEAPKELISIEWQKDQKSGQFLVIRILNHTKHPIGNVIALAEDLALWEPRNQRFVHDSPRAVNLSFPSPVKPKELVGNSNRCVLVQKSPNEPAKFQLKAGPHTSRSEKGIWRVTVKHNVKGHESYRGWHESYLFFRFNPGQTPELIAARDPKAELAEGE